MFVVGGTECCPRGYHPIHQAEIFDPATQQWALARGKITRAQGAAALLPDGRVLVVSGIRGIWGDWNVVRSVGLYDPSARTWDRVAKISTGRALFSLTVLQDGRVLAVGGVTGDGAPCLDLATAEAFDVDRGWLPAGQMGVPRMNHEALRLNDDRVLVIGGRDCDGHTHASAELYQP